VSSLKRRPCARSDGTKFVRRVLFSIAGSGPCEASVTERRDCAPALRWEHPMSLSALYLNKAEQCDRLAAAATDPRIRAKHKDEGVLWRGIAKDIDRQDRDEAGPS
jgi:hypothetical protein